MPTEVFMPQLGMTMSEGTVVRWLKREGEPVAKGEIVLEVLTDKATVEVESAASGILSGIRVAEGESVPVGTVMALILASGEAPPADLGAARGPVEQAQAKAPGIPSSTPSPGSLWVAGAGVPETMLPARTSRRALKISPRARRVANQQNVDWKTLPGTGPGGRIVEADVGRAPVAQRVATDLGVELESVRGTGPGGRVTRADVEHAAAQRPLKGIRKLVAERMAHSASTVPHFHLMVEADAFMLTRMRARLEPRVEAQVHVHLTFTDLLVVLLARALRRHPEVNVAWADGAIKPQRHIGIGIATATDAGLVVPVIQEADAQSLSEVVQRRQELAEKARAGRLSLQDLEGGTFTLTNLGMFKVDNFDPIVNEPQVAILAVGRIKERAFVVDGQLSARPTIHLTLAIDHRVLDGAGAAQFLNTLVELIEEPYMLAEDLFS